MGGRGLFTAASAKVALETYSEVILSLACVALYRMQTPTFWRGLCGRHVISATTREKHRGPQSSVACLICVMPFDTKGLQC